MNIVNADEVVNTLIYISYATNRHEYGMSVEGAAKIYPDAEKLEAAYQKLHSKDREDMK